MIPPTAPAVTLLAATQVEVEISHLAVQTLQKEKHPHRSEDVFLEISFNCTPEVDK
jgi:hypothetical protein